MKLKEIREEIGLSQKELAKKMQVSPTNIYNYETGRTEPNIDVLLKLSKILNVSVDYLISREDSDVQPSATNQSTDFYLSKEEKELIKYYRAIGKSAKLAIYNTAKSFYSQLPQADKIFNA